MVKQTKIPIYLRGWAKNFRPNEDTRHCIARFPIFSIFTKTLTLTAK